MWMAYSSHPSSESSSGMMPLPAPWQQSSATRKRRARIPATSSHGSASSWRTCRSTAPSSVTTSPSWSHVARGMPASSSARMSAPSCAERNRPLGPMNLRAFHSMGLWLAVIAKPPAA
jgi:hypothetical protein